MNIHIKTILGAFLLSSVANCYATPLLTEDQINKARSLANQEISYEDFRNQQQVKEGAKKDWLTIVPFEFEYKGEKKKLCMAQGDDLHTFAEIAVYAEDVDPTKIDYLKGVFYASRRTATILSSLVYEFRPATNTYPAHFILEKVETEDPYLGKGYSQAAVKYFIDEFVTKRTNVKYIFADLRYQVSQHYFPKYGFQKGLIEEFKDVKFERPMANPYTWVKK